MGWIFRKSVSLGPIRLNYSKSGLGVSAGVKGARISYGPRGTYINLGSNGIYYRKKISERSSSNSVYGCKDNQIQACEATDAIKVSGGASNSEFARGLVKKIKKLRLFILLLLIMSFGLIWFLKIWGFALTFVIVIPSLILFPVKLHYDLDKEAELEWTKFTEFIYGMRCSKKLWFIEEMSFNSNTKVNAGAYKNLSRGLVTLSLVKSNRPTGFSVNTNVPTALIHNRKCKLLFLPNCVLIEKGLRVVAYSYDEISIISSVTSFVEEEVVAKDAEIARYTWQFVNIDGTPDKRYNRNKELPVCLYGSLVIRGDNLEVELQSSNKYVVSNVESAYQHYVKYIKKLEGRRYNLLYQDTQDIVPSDEKKISSLEIEAPSNGDDLNIRPKKVKCYTKTEYDKYIVEAAEEVLSSQKSSTILLQRKLKLGFSHAENIMKQLEEIGVVGSEEDGNRRILINFDAWEKLRENMGLTKNEDLSVNKAEIILRDFAQFTIGESTICIYDNLIHVSKPIIAQDGAATLTSSFRGNKVRGIIYKKPSLFSKGYIEFEFDSNTELKNETPDLIQADISDFSNFTKIEFVLKQDRIANLFLEQVSEDIKVQIKHM